MAKTHLAPLGLNNRSSLAARIVATAFLGASVLGAAVNSADAAPCFDYQMPKLESTLVLPNPWCMAMIGPYAYIESEFRTYIYDFSSPESPVLVGKFDDWGPYVTNREGDWMVMTSMTEASVWDVSDPVAPEPLSWFGEFHTDAAIHQGYAYSAHSDSIVVWSMADPVVPVRLASFRPGWTTSLTAADGILYRLFGGRLESYRLDDPVHPVLADAIEWEGSWLEPYSARVEGDRLYFLHTWKSTGVSVVDISDPDHLVYLGGRSVGSVSLDVRDGRLPVDGILYIDRAGESVQILDRYSRSGVIGKDIAILQNNASIDAYTFRHADPLDRVADLTGTAAVDGNRILAWATGESRLVSVDENGAFQLRGAVDFSPSSFWSARFGGDRVFCSLTGGKFAVVDISDMDAPVIEGTTDVGWIAPDLDLEGDLLAAAAGSSGVRLVDVSTNVPLELAVVPAMDEVLDVALDGTRLFYVDGEEVIALDVTNSASPVKIAAISVPGAESLEAGAGLLYVGGQGGLLIYDITDPMSPVLLSTLEIQRPGRLYVRGDVGLASTKNGRACLLDLTDPSEPSVIGVYPTDTSSLRLDNGGIGDHFILSGPSGLRSLPLPCGLTTSVEVSPMADRADIGIANPNPFRNRAELEFRLPSGGVAKLRIYNADGRLVRTFPTRVVATGIASWDWDGLDDGGREVPAGFYAARLEVGRRVYSARLLRVN
ncbi:MAG: hypothetical protein KDA27_26515 [Candidatus Eisenbacteria bacterium]|uniref:FlgD/Vpr Ig-like domain-containing protein n=1 Tax=Eiseniibacteriota bacterium TaxID=2212470 RepID=A0A956NLI8_UNCEI|nr:hypothetical protein [Candidatus Eisenbacteria bacterium]